MGKLTKALETIKAECDKQKWCYSCPLRCQNKYGETDCLITLWTEDSREPWEWPIGDVEETENERDDK